MPNDQEITPSNSNVNPEAPVNNPQEQTSGYSPVNSNPSAVDAEPATFAAPNSPSAAAVDSEPATTQPVSASPTPTPIATTPAASAFGSFSNEPVAAGSGTAPAAPSGPMGFFKKSKKRTAIVLTAVAVVVLGGGGAAAYNLWYQNPEKVLGDAMSNMLSAKSASTDSILTVDSSGDAKYNVDFKLKTLSDQDNAELDMSVSAEAEGKDYNLSGNVIVKNNEKLFFKINDLKKTLEDTGLMSYVGSSASAVSFIEKIDGTWIVVDQDDLDEATGSDDKTTECIENAVKKLRDDKEYAKDVRELYKKNPLVKVTKKLGSKDGSLGYEIEFVRENAVKFANGMNDTKFYKDIKKCDSSIEDLDGEEMFKEDEDAKDEDKATVNVWIDRWSHQLTKLEINGSADDTKVSFTMNTKFNVPVKIDEPKDPITIDELEADIEKIQQENMSLNDASTLETEQLNYETDNAGSMSGLSNILNL